MKKIQIIRKKEFTRIALDLDYRIFLLYIATLNISFNTGRKVCPSKKAQITHLKVDDTLKKVSSKYANFTNVFLLELTIELFKYIGIIDYAIELIND